ncbi:hypothetical protein BDV59DRAFT_176779 [Aspergillus ambiguus]|uniref:transcription factor domain-containing protein n=1 Tax=Aspergillus ambiguus TaxID=176160 RepID=UPI003CCD76F8
MLSSVSTPNGETSRTGAACLICRVKKRGCDRIKPACGPCESRGQTGECIYPEASTPHRRETLSSRREIHRPACAKCRISKRRCGRETPVCSQCQNRRQGSECSYLPENMPVFPPRKRQRSPKMLTPAVVIDSVGPPPPEPTDHVNGTASEESAGETCSRDDLAEVFSDGSFHTAIEPQGSGPFENPSSHLKLLRNALDRRIDELKDEERDEAAPASNVIGEELPPKLSRKLMDQLVHTYITREYVNLPIVDLTDFQSMYKTAATQGTSACPDLFQGILNIIFGLSALNRKDVDDTVAQKLFDSGYRLTGHAGYNGLALQQAQAYLLQSQYLHATRKPKLAWASLGHAVRTIQVLELQREAGDQDSRRQRGPELTRRLWHSAMIMERMLALQLGLPPQTSGPLRKSLPSHLDADYLDVISGGEPALSGERPSLVEFVAACARLYSHVEDIMAWERELRLRRETCAMKKLLALDFQPFLKVDSLLHDWQTSLPSFLNHTTTGDLWEDPIVRRQRNILRVRYLYFRLRLLRPLMILGLALYTNCNCGRRDRSHVAGDELDSPESPVAWCLVRDSSIRCIATASELVNLLKANEEGPLDGGPHDGHRSPIPPYWENVDYLHACGTVLLAGRLCPFARRRGPDETSWARVLELLKRYEGPRASGDTEDAARQCRATLERLSESAVKLPTAATMSHSTNKVSHAAALDEDMRDPRGSERIGADLPLQQRPFKRRRLGSDIGRCASFGWIESLPSDLVGMVE